MFKYCWNHGQEWATSFFSDKPRWPACSTWQLQNHWKSMIHMKTVENPTSTIVLANRPRWYQNQLQVDFHDMSDMMFHCHGNAFHGGSGCRKRSVSKDQRWSQLSRWFIAYYPAQWSNNIPCHGKISTMLLIGKPFISMGHLYHGKLLPSGNLT